MCWPHWCRVPKVLNREVFRNYRDHGVRSSGYIVARQEAIDAVVAKEAAEGPTNTATCIMPNCRKRTPAAEPFCAVHR